ALKPSNQVELSRTVWVALRFAILNTLLFKACASVALTLNPMSTIDMGEEVLNADSRLLKSFLITLDVVPLRTTRSIGVRIMDITKLATCDGLLKLSKCAIMLATDSSRLSVKRGLSRNGHEKAKSTS